LLPEPPLESAPPAAHGQTIASKAAQIAMIKNLFIGLFTFISLFTLINLFT
jgi:hypothetical protein